MSKGKDIVRLIDSNTLVEKLSYLLERLVISSIENLNIAKVS